jgi:hypothetical protein
METEIIIGNRPFTMEDVREITIGAILPEFKTPPDKSREQPYSDYTKERKELFKHETQEDFLAEADRLESLGIRPFDENGRVIKV